MNGSILKGLIDIRDTDIQRPSVNDDMEGVETLSKSHEGHE
jgi:hypothetical protein